MESYYTLILIIYLFIATWVFLKFCFGLQNVQIFNDEKDFENNLIIGLVVSVLSAIWFIVFPIFIYTQRK